MPSARRKNAKRRKLHGRETFEGTTAYNQRIREMNSDALRITYAFTYGDGPVPKRK